jgi:hypothetical protein
MSMRSTRHNILIVLALLGLASTTTGCVGTDPTRGQHGGTTMLLVGLSAQEKADQHATTLGCAKETISWAAKEGSELIMAPVGQPGEEQWKTVDFALHTSAQQTNPFAAKRWRTQQSSVANKDLAVIQSHTPQRKSLDMLATATDGSRVLNYQHGPRTLVLCTAAQQSSREFTLGSTPMSHSGIEATLARLQPELEPMRLTRVVFGAAGDAEQTNQSLTEQAAHEEFWRAWAHHEGAIHFSFGPIPHYPYA